jgi:hypothetical protein
MKTIPVKDSDFDVKSDVIINGADEHRDEWGLDGDFLDNVQTKRDTWKDKYQTYLPAATRTPLITFEKNEARKALEKDLRLLVKNLQSNPRVSADNLLALGIALPDQTKTPVPPPTTYPDFTTDSSMIRRLTVHFRDHGSTSAAKPKGVHGAEIRWAILDAPPTGVAALVNSSFDTRTPFTLEFDDAERGETVWFCLRWENTRGEKGPWSEMVSAIVP